MKLLARQGYKVLIMRRTGGLDRVGGKYVPFVDRRFPITNRAIAETEMIPGDYAFPVNPDYVDIDLQVDRFLHSGPDEFHGRIVAIDYELYGPEPEATCTPDGLKEFMRVLRRHIGRRPILLYAGKAFWREEPHSGYVRDYGDNVHLWNPWYWSLEVRPHPWTHYKEGLRHSGWWHKYAGARPICAQFCIGRAAGIPLDINAWRIDMPSIRRLTRPVLASTDRR